MPVRVFFRKQSHILFRLTAPVNRVAATMPRLVLPIILMLTYASCVGWGTFWVIDGDGSGYRLIADTGQTTCAASASGNGAMTACGGVPVTGQDGHFVNIPNARSFSGPTAFGATTNRTTRDNLTGLVWKTCAEGYTDPSCTGGASSFDWSSAPAACSALNASAYAGITNWRLPSIEELQSIAYYAAANPFIEQAYFTAADSGSYWSSTTSAANSLNAWYFTFNSGWADTQLKTTGTTRVRCVSGTKLSASVYRDNADGTVSDLTTKLRWQKCNAGLGGQGCTGTLSNLNWSNAIAYCQGLSLASRSWRLPNVNELTSLVDYSVTAPPINAIFPNTEQNLHWTSTSDSTGGNAVNMSFLVGFHGNADKNASTLPIRCVATE